MPQVLLTRMCFIAKAEKMTFFEFHGKNLQMHEILIWSLECSAS